MKISQQTIDEVARVSRQCGTVEQQHSCPHDVPRSRDCAKCKKETLDALRELAGNGNAHARRVLAMFGKEAMQS